MSKSYKKKPYYRLVSMSDNHVKNIKRETNRAYRRGLKQGRFDDQVAFGKATKEYRKVYDIEYTYDYFTRYAHSEHRNEEWYKKDMRK